MTGWTIMGDRLDDLERRIDELRAGVRRAMRARDPAAARTLRADLRAAERAWDALVSGGLDPASAADDAAHAVGDPASGVIGPTGEQGGGNLAGSGSAGGPRNAAGSGNAGESGNAGGGGNRGGSRKVAGSGNGGAAGRGGLRLVTVREQAHQALTLLGVPAQPRLLAAVSEAFFGGSLRGAQLTSLRRDEERSFASSPFGRPYYLCAALTDRLSPARGLLAVSTWPLERRMVGPLSPRVHFLTCAVAVARRLCPDSGAPAVGTGLGTGTDEPDPQVERLLARMARNIPGGAAHDLGPPDPLRVIEAARAELAVHAGRDTRDRAELAKRAAAQLGDRARLFGAATLSTVAAARAATARTAT
ncbi:MULTISPECIES: hypothetical protein [unclassified Nonomuraea]|uniref:hypothetical protein n=1 Tax=unclassified Nonomuraea TaxID=2593643 RepID=UPI0033EE2A02